MMTLALASTYDPSRFTRRAFLSGATALLATSLLPRGSFAADGPMARDFFTPDENARRRRRQLDAPLIVGDDTVIADTDFVVGPSFVPSSVNAALYMPGRRISIKNCRVVNPVQQWDHAWDRGPDRMGWTGVRIDGAQNLIVDGLHVEGFPHSGIHAYGIRTARVERVSATRCFFGVAFSSPKGGSQNLSIDQLSVWDTWGPGKGAFPAHDTQPSRIRPNGWIGADGFIGERLNDATLRNFDFSGELYTGMKLLRSKRVFIADVKTNHLMIQGTEHRHGNDDGLTDGSEAITVRGLIVDKRRGIGQSSDLSNGIQVSFNVHGLDIADFSLIAGGSDGHAIQLAHDCDAIVRNGVIDGFNGHRGTQPAAALELIDNSTINDDFGDDGPEGGPQRNQANRFHNQTRIRA